MGHTYTFAHTLFYGTAFLFLITLTGAEPALTTKCSYRAVAKQRLICNRNPLKKGVQKLKLPVLLSD